jgi:cell wall-associated NlpC family hydrolase
MTTLKPSANKTKAQTTFLPTLREGSQGPVVRDLQNLLNERGFNCGKPDAEFGPKTKQAVKDFQRAQGLSQDGVVGQNTWDRLKGGPIKPRPSQGTSEAFVQRALAQRGDRYIFGAEAKPNDPNPKAFDCSELVQWAAHQVGVSIPDGTMNQLPHIQRAGKTLPVSRAIRTRGALLFRPGHVAISLGNGKTIEAKGSQYGVGVFSAEGRRWTVGGLIPGMRY